MSTYQLQFPLSKNIKDIAEQKAKRIGIDNINDLIRFLVYNFCEDRVSINIQPENHDALSGKREIALTPLEISARFDGLSYGTSENYHYIYEADRFDTASKIIPLQTQWNKFLEYQYDFTKPGEIVFIMIFDKTLIKRISQEISGSVIMCGIDAAARIVYVNMSEDIPNSLSLLRMESTRLYMNWNRKETAKLLFTTEYISQFNRYYGEKLSVDETLPVNTEALKYVSLDDLGSYRTDQAKQDLSIMTACAIYAYLYNHHGFEKFTGFIKYYLKFPNMPIKNAYRKYFKKELKLPN